MYTPTFFVVGHANTVIRAFPNCAVAKALHPISTIAGAKISWKRARSSSRG